MTALESARSELSGKIPDRLGYLGLHESQIESAVEFGIEVSDVHEPQLRALMKCGRPPVPPSIRSTYRIQEADLPGKVR